MSTTSPNGTCYCDHCGFADCSGASGGLCPRWPAAAPMDLVPEEGVPGSLAWTARRLEESTQWRFTCPEHGWASNLIPCPDDRHKQDSSEGDEQ